MKISLSWIKEYIDLDLPTEKIESALTLAGLEVEGIEEGMDTIFEIGLTPNLGHCMSILGMARELSAILKLPLKHKGFSFEELAENTDVEVKIEDPKKCFQYRCRAVKGIRIGPSPDWLKERLESLGTRSVNNVVDIGNYVMLELGQPLHMFDLGKLTGLKIVVKSGLSGKMTTLDEVEREIPNEALMICDGEKPVAFAGVMGGLETSVDEATVDILIEGAEFTPQAVRKTSKLLNLRSESSLRFERGIDPLGVSLAIDYAAKLLSDIADGKICKGSSGEIAQEFVATSIEMSPKYCNRILGTHLSTAEMATLLKRLQIEILEESNEKIVASIPSYRNDLTIDIDLVEEVGRIYGFNHIPRKRPVHVSSTLSHSPLYLFEQLCREKLAYGGLQECLTCDLIHPKLANLVSESARGKESLIAVLHPASIDQSVLRPSLLPGLLSALKFNLDRQNTDLALFEVGHIHFMEKKEPIGRAAAAIVLTGKSAPYHFETKPQNVDFFDLKGQIENFLSSLKMENRFEVSHLHTFHPGRQAHVFVNEQMVGALGAVHPKHLRALGINQEVYFAELDLKDLMENEKKAVKVASFSPYPGSQRDWTLTLDERATIETLLGAVLELQSPLMENVFLLDIFRSEKLGKNKKNVTLRFHYRDPNQTIQAETVEKEHTRIISAVEKKLANVVR